MECRGRAIYFWKIKIEKDKKFENTKAQKQVFKF